MNIALGPFQQFQYFIWDLFHNLKIHFGTYSIDNFLNTACGIGPKPSQYAKDLLLWLQLKGFYGVRVLSCTLKSSLTTKALLRWWQLRGFSSLWVLSCTSKSSKETKAFFAIDAIKAGFLFHHSSGKRSK